MEMPYWHDIQQIIDIHGDNEQTKTLPPYILRMLYFSMVNANLNYGI